MSMQNTPPNKSSWGIGLGGIGAALAALEHRHAIELLHEVYQPCGCASAFDVAAFTWQLHDTTLLAVIAYTAFLVGSICAIGYLSWSAMVMLSRRVRKKPPVDGEE